MNTNTTRCLLMGALICGICTRALAEGAATGPDVAQSRANDVYYGLHGPSTVKALWSQRLEVKEGEWRTLPLDPGAPAHAKAMRVAGNTKWLGALVRFRPPIPLDRPVWLKFRCSPEGVAESIAPLIFTSDTPHQQHNPIAPAGIRYSDPDKWYTSYVRLNDFVSGNDKILTAIKIAQRCRQGTELPDNKCPPHGFLLDDFLVATGPSIEEEARRFATLSTYEGGLAYRLKALGDVAVWHVPSTVKVSRTMAVPSARKAGIEVSLARNEYESFQFVVTPTQSKPGTLQLHFEDLSCSEARLSKNDIAWYPEVYLRCKGRHGVSVDEWWPDVLSRDRALPLEKVRNHPLWVTVHARADQPAGRYTGEFTISLDRAGEKTEVTVPLTVRVWDFALPRGPTFRTNQQLWGLSSRNAYHWKRRREFWRILADHKMYDAQSCFKDLEFCVKGLGQNVFKIFKGGGSRGPRKIEGHAIFTPGYNEALERTVRRSLDRLAVVGVTPENSFVYAYLWNETCGRVEQYPMIAHIGQQVARVNPLIKRLGAIAYHPSLRDKIDIVCDGYNQRILRKEARPKNLQIWRSGVLPFRLPVSGIDVRLSYGLDSVREDITGAFCWGINWWPAQKGDTFDPKVPWERVHRHNHHATLIYPGASRYSRDPALCFSLRLELGRDGIEDYEYVTLLKRCLEETNDPAKRKAVQAVLQEVRTADLRCDIWAKRTRFDTVDTLHTLRLKMGDLLEDVLRADLGPGHKDGQ